MKLYNILGIVGACIIGYLLLSYNHIVKELYETKNELRIETVAHHKADSINWVYLDSLTYNKTIISRLQKDYNRSKEKVSELNKLLKVAMDNIDNDIPYDSSYAYLNNKYPFVGEKIYPFNGPQVKQFHKLDVKGIWDDSKILTLSLNINKADSIISYKDKQIKYYDVLYTNCVADGTLYKKEILKLTSDYNKVNSKLDKVKLTRNVTLGGLAVFIAVKTLEIIF